ncbi:hypothetical protein BJ742DRAFT_181342 [Cladochytrium replicatum]|nr:hypothetical protein BJ742DRAFT_181342 [Cladochytrium replicatum]
MQRRRSSEPQAQFYPHSRRKSSGSASIMGHETTPFISDMRGFVEELMSLKNDMDTMKGRIDYLLLMVSSSGQRGLNFGILDRIPGSQLIAPIVTSSSPASSVFLGRRNSARAHSLQAADDESNDSTPTMDRSSEILGSTSAPNLAIEMFDDDASTTQPTQIISPTVLFSKANATLSPFAGSGSRPLSRKPSFQGNLSTHRELDSTMIVPNPSSPFVSAELERQLNQQLVRSDPFLARRASFVNVSTANQMPSTGPPIGLMSNSNSEDEVNVQLETMSIMSAPQISPQITKMRAETPRGPLPVDRLKARQRALSTTSLSMAATTIKTKMVETGQKRLFEARFDEHGSLSSGLNMVYSMFNDPSKKKCKVRGIHARSEFVVWWEFLMTIIYLFIMFYIPVLPTHMTNIRTFQLPFTVSCTVIFTIDTILNLLIIRNIPNPPTKVSPEPTPSPQNRSQPILMITTVDSNGTTEGISEKDLTKTPTIEDTDTPLSIKHAQPQTSKPTKPLSPLARSQLAYLKGMFIFDLLSCLPLDLLPLQGADYFVFLRLIRIHRFFAHVRDNPIVHKLRRKLASNLGFNESFQTIFVLFFLMIFYLHLHACFVFILGRITNYEGWTGQSSYSLRQDLRTLPAGDQYTMAMLIAWGNTFPLGTKPSSLIEMWAYMLFVFTGASLYAAIFGFMSAFSFGFDASGRLFKQKLDEVTEYMTVKQVPPDLRKKIRHYFDLKYRGKYFQEEAILDEFNSSLRQEITIHNLKHIVEQVPFLRRNLNDGHDEEYHGRLTTALKACFYVRGDTVTRQGEIGTTMYFIVAGSLEVRVNGKRVGLLRDGNFFGEIGLIVPLPRQATVIAVSSSRLYRLDREEFLPILEDFDDVRVRVSEIYRERMSKIAKDKEAKEKQLMVEQRELERLRSEKEKKNEMKIRWERTLSGKEEGDFGAKLSGFR